MGPPRGGATPSHGPVAAVAQDPVYRSIFLILVIQGVVFGGQMPFMPLWAQDRLGAGSVEVGTISLVSSIVTTAFGLAFGLVTDRTRRRVAWMVAAYALALPMRVALAYVTDLVLGTVMYAAVGMAMFVLFYAVLGDWFRHRSEPRSAEVTNVVRLGFTIGWLVGALGAGWWVKAFDYDGLFLATAVLQAASVALLLAGVRDAPIARDAATGTGDGAPLWHEVARPAVLWYLLTTTFTGAAGVARMTLLPLYLRDVVHADVDQIGVVFGIEPLYEIPVSLLAGMVVARLGVERLMLVGIGAGVLYFGAVAATTTFMPFLAIEALYAVVVTATFGFGLIHVQNLLPRRGGAAISAYNAAATVGPVVAAPALGSVADNLGWEPVYVTAALLMAVAMATMWLSDRASKEERLLASSRPRVAPLAQT